MKNIWSSPGWWFCEVRRLRHKMTAPPSPEAATKAVFAKHAVCLVLDYGSQYTQLIARRVREAGVLSVLLPGDASLVGVEVGKCGQRSMMLFMTRIDEQYGIGYAFAFAST